MEKYNYLEAVMDDDAKAALIKTNSGRQILSFPLLHWDKEIYFDAELICEIRDAEGFFEWEFIDRTAAGFFPNVMFNFPIDDDEASVIESYTFIC